ncbi:MAG: outer membrane lipoprotein carrier protein LolA [Acidobacteriaceae bacterium]|nr:outer membrane lipoprotein carrier protein LolA [Acidobacteriaceae bacterium]
MTPRRVLIALSVIIVFTLSLHAAPPTATELAQSLQKKYDGVRDFSADFTHTYRGGVLRKELSEKGRVVIKKPGKMRWDYLSPEVKTFVSDGTKIYSYIPQDKQVIVSTVPKEDTAATPALFLAGKGNLLRDFTVTLGDVPAGQPDGTVALMLTPKTPQPDYDWLLLLVDPSSFTLRGLVTADTQGGTSSLTFTNLKENIGVPDSSFVFNIPRGVDVVTDASGK